MCKGVVFSVIAATLLGLGNRTSATSFTELKVDLALAQYENPSLIWPETAKSGWTMWAAPGWADMYSHDLRVLQNIDGSGVEARMTLVNEGDGGLKVSGLIGALAGALPPWGSPICEPICNSWYQAVDFPDNPLADIQLAFHNLVPGEYVLYSYHNHFGCERIPGTDDPTWVECICTCWQQPPMPSIRAMSVHERRYLPGYEAYGDAFNKLFPGVDWDTGPFPEGVTAIQNAYDVTIQQVCSDDDLIPSEIRFATDGSPVLILYQGGCCMNDGIRPTRWGGRAILNAFHLALVREQVKAYDPDPSNGAENVSPAAIFSWKAGNCASSHDFYIGTNWNDVNNANNTNHPNVIYHNLTSSSVDPPGFLQLNRTYYWRVDEVNAVHPNSPWKGDVWHFTVEDGRAHDASPSHGTVGVSLDGTTLSWTPSAIANFHDVYFGTDFNDVNSAADPYVEPGKGRQTLTSYDPNPLQFGQDYYWRIDEVGGLGLIRGPVWTFRTIGYCLMHYKFDGVEDANLPDPIIDSTGNVAFEHWKGPGSGGSSTYGPTNPLVNTDGTSAHFRPEYGFSAGLCRDVLGSDPLDLNGPAYTVEMWVRQDLRGSEQAEEEDFEATLFRRYDRSYVIAIGDDGAVRFVHAGYGDTGRTLESPADRIGLGQWHHIAAVFDSSDPARAEKLYVDCLLADDSNSSTLNPSDDDDPVTIGVTINPLRAGSKHASNPLNGLIDELRIVDTALGPAQFLVRGDPALAWLPIPYDQAKQVPPVVRLTWEPGAYAGSHDVYLGTNYAGVDDANQTIHPDIHYINIDVNSYDVPFALELGQVYYWRVDEVNSTCPNSPWKGNIWRFTAAEYVTLDDMEDYTPDYGSDYPISDFIEPYGWDCGFTNATGSILSLQTNSPVRGEKSMFYGYDNTIYGYYYSEISNHFGLDPCDWAALNIKSLTLWFHGDPNNDADHTEQMYIGLEDSTNNYAEVRYPLGDMDDIRLGEWQQWNIDLQELTGINLSTVQKLYIGFGDRYNTSEFGGMGVVCFDDLQLYVPRCVSEYGPANDLNEDCIIDYADIRIMADDWLHEGGSVADLHEDSKVNLKDFAALSDTWLQQQLWPR